MTLSRRTPLKRTPLKRKRSTARRLPAVQCKFQRCHNRPRAAGFCHTHLEREADRVFSLWIRARDGACRNCGQTQALQCGHLVSRRYRALRWHEQGAVALCVRCHKNFTEHPLEWEQWVNRHDELWSWSRLRTYALTTEPQDPAEALERFSAEAAA